MGILKDMLLATDGTPRMVRFVRYRAGMLWYATESGFEFPVPIADVGEATFLAQDKATLFMRYIRRHLDLLQAA